MRKNSKSRPKRASKARYETQTQASDARPPSPKKISRKSAPKKKNPPASNSRALELARKTKDIDSDMKGILYEYGIDTPERLMEFMGYLECLIYDMLVRPQRIGPYREKMDFHKRAKDMVYKWYKQEVPHYFKNYREYRIEKMRARSSNTGAEDQTEIELYLLYKESVEQRKGKGQSVDNKLGHWQ